MSRSLDVAVIGAGVAGLTAAYLLSRRHRVTVFEQDRRLGGHAHTHRVETTEGLWQLDSGFIVYNNRTYPNFVRLLEELGVPGQDSDMSFGVRCRRCRLEYSSRGPLGLFAQLRRVADPGHLRMLSDIPRFNRAARAFLSRGGDETTTLGEFLVGAGVGEGFVRHFLLPMGGAIWSASAGDVRAFQAEAFLRFFSNHGWLTLDGAPRWRTVTGGSQAYVRAIERATPARFLRGAAVSRVARSRDGVSVTTADGTVSFDRAVLATHADQALALLADPSEPEREALGAFRYSRNPAVLHTDVRALPAQRGAWASWNCDLDDCRDGAAPVSVTYHLNRLQSLEAKSQFCVTLNRDDVAPSSVLRRMSYTHPIMDAAATRAQFQLRELSGEHHTLFAGAHLRYGFHEDGVMSAVAAARRLGVEW
jgi:predicted NAD/FAD-binding protein